MNRNEFLWHAKRGHGDCFLIMQEGNIMYYKDIVRKIFLNNYAFLKSDEYRSFYACELVDFYNGDMSFLESLLFKLNRTNLDNFHVFDYLINNLYFFLKKNKKYKLDGKIKKLLIRNLNKDFYTIEECDSICSLISLILDLKMNIPVKKIIEDHYSRFNNSNLDVSHIEYIYKISLSYNNKKSILRNVEIFNNFNLLIAYISDNETFNKLLAYISMNISNEYIDLLLQLLDDDTIDNNIKTNILKVIYHSKKRRVYYIKKLIKIIEHSNYEQKSIIYEIITEIKSTNVFRILNPVNMDDCLFIRLSLKNYNEDQYGEIHKRISRLKINYNNYNFWYEIESALINYFNKRVVDKRLLNDLKFFFKNGLSSYTRYKIALILRKYNMLEANEIRALKYDANVETRRKFSTL